MKGRAKSAAAETSNRKRLRRRRDPLRARLEAEAAGLSHDRWPGREGQPPISMQSLVLNVGRPYVPRALSEEEARIVDEVVAAHHRLWGPFVYQQCFVNSQRALLAAPSRRVYYVEGYVWQQGVCNLHGWLSINEKVVDFTGIAEDEAAPPPEPPRTLGRFDAKYYWGIPFLRAYVRKRATAPGGFGTLIDDWGQGFPLFTLPEGRWRRHEGRTAE